MIIVPKKIILRSNNSWLTSMTSDRELEQVEFVRNSCMLVALVYIACWDCLLLVACMVS